MSDFADSNGNTVGYLTLDMVDGDVIGPLVFDCVAQNLRFLRAGSAASLLIEGRQHGTVNPFINLATTGQDLSGFTPGSIVQFDIRFTAIQATGRSRPALTLGVIDAPATAGWAI